MASKGKRKASSSRVYSTDLSKLLTTQQQRDKFSTHYINKSITPPKYGKLTTFSDECFDFPQFFRDQKIYDFVSDSGVYYPDVVKAFYCNMSFENNVMTSAVRGVPISLTVQTLGEYLGIPFEGVEIKSGLKANLPNYSKKEFYYNLSRVSEEQFLSKRKELSGKQPEKVFWSAGNFPVDDRMMHYFMAHVLGPKSSNHTSITDSEMQMLFAIKNDLQVNWAYAIFHHMASLHEHSASLPYARPLTKIFKKCNVNLTKELCVKMTEEECAITSDILNGKMGVLYDPIAQTITYLKSTPSVPKPSPSGPSYQDIMDFMRQGFARMDQGFAQMNLNFGLLKEEFGYLRQDLAGLAYRMGQYDAFRRGERNEPMNQD